MMKLLLAFLQTFLFSHLVLSQTASASEIEFVDSTNCSPPTPLYSCNFGPKAWTAEEKLKIESAFLQIKSSDLGAKMIAKIFAEQGIIKLYRAGYRGADLAAADPRPPRIYFFERRFEQKMQSYDPALASTLAHELAHIYDCLPSNAIGTSCLSAQPEFLQLMNLENVEESENSRTVIVARPVGFSLAQHVRSLERSLQLLERNNYPRAKIALDAYARSIGLPSNYSLRNPAEMFAEIVAFMITDQTHQTILAAPVKSWFISELSQP